MSESTLKEFMSAETRRSLGSKPTYHVNCRKADSMGRSRPGKTARDRTRRLAR